MGPLDNMARYADLNILILLLLLISQLIDGQRTWRRTNRRNYQTNNYSSRNRNRNRRTYYGRNNSNQIQRGRTYYSSGYQGDYASFRSSLEGLPNFFILRGGTFY